MRRFLRRNRLAFIIGLAVVAFILGYIGFDLYHEAQGDAHTVPYTVYRTLGLFGLEAGLVEAPVPWPLQVARFLAPAVAAYAIFTALMAAFYQQVQYLILRIARDNIIICGLGKRGLFLARGFHGAGRRVTVIERDADNDNLRSCREGGIATLIGDAKDRSLLEKAGIQRAKYLICVTGSDGVNAEIAVCAQDIVESKKGGPVTCFVHISDIGLCRLLRVKEMLERRSGQFGLEFFNIFETGARVLLDRFPPFGPDGNGTHGHVLVVGIGRMGESLIMRAVRDWRDMHGESGNRLRIGISDPDAGEFIGSLRRRYPNIEKYCELVPKPMDVDVCDRETIDELLDISAGELTSIYICLDDDSAGLSTAIALHGHLRERRRTPPIVVRMTERTGLAELLTRRPNDGGEFENVHAFCLLDETCRPDLILGGVIEVIARAIHREYVRAEEAKAEAARAKGGTPDANPSAVPWDKLSEDLRNSNRGQARHIAERLKQLGYTIVCLSDWDAEFYEFPDHEVEAMAGVEHDRWWNEKKAAGWTHGEGPKDPDKKTHPDMVPWEKLDEETRDKDRNAVREAPRFLARAGFQIVRVGSPPPQDKA